MPPTLELTPKRRKKLRKAKEKAELFVKLLRELNDAETFRLYASGKTAIAKRHKGIAAEDILAGLHLK